MNRFPFGDDSLQEICTFVKGKRLVVKYKILTTDEPASHLFLMLIQFAIMWLDAVKLWLTTSIEKYLEQYL